MLRQVDTINDVFLEFEYENEKYPAGWTRCWGDGKASYLAPGHDGRTGNRKEFQDLLRIAVQKLVK